MRIRRSVPFRQLHRGLVKIVAGAAVTILLVTAGCATRNHAYQGGASSMEYNPQTGYPLIGGPKWSF